MPSSASTCNANHRPSCDHGNDRIAAFPCSGSAGRPLTLGRLRCRPVPDGRASACPARPDPDDGTRSWCRTSARRHPATSGHAPAARAVGSRRWCGRCGRRSGATCRRRSSCTRAPGSRSRGEGRTPQHGLFSGRQRCGLPAHQDPHPSMPSRQNVVLIVQRPAHAEDSALLLSVIHVIFRSAMIRMTVRLHMVRRHVARYRPGRWRDDVAGTTPFRPITVRNAIWNALGRAILRLISALHGLPLLTFRVLCHVVPPDASV